MMAGLRRTGVAVAIGNYLEFYNFLVVATFAPMIGRTLFAAGTPAVQTAVAWSVFAVSFVARPVGAVVLGRLATRRGGRTALIGSLVLMGSGTVIVACCPGFGTVGWLAPMVVISGRLLQGFAEGGEVGPASVTLLDLAPEGQQMAWVMLQFVTQHAAALSGISVGLALSAVLSDAQLYAWGWRLGLGLGLVVVPVGLWLRRDLASHQATTRPEASAGQAACRPRWSREGLVLLVMVGLTSMAYGRAYGTTYGITVLRLHASAAMTATAVGLAASIAGMGVGLRLVAIFGARMTVMASLSGSALACVPLFSWMTPLCSRWALTATLSVMGFLGGMPLAPLMLAMLKTLPRDGRAVGFGFIYAIAVATCGATTPAVLGWLYSWDGDPAWPARFYMGAAVMTLVGAVPLLSRGVGVTAMAGRYRTVGGGVESSGSGMNS